jgi:hypothetical protein
LLLNGTKYPPFQFRTLQAGNGVTLSLSSDSNSVVISANVPVTASPIYYSTSDIVISVNNSAISFGLSNSGANPGVYTHPTIAVDMHGRITSISNGSISNASIGITSSDILISNTPVYISNGGVFNLTLSNTGVVAGTYSLATIAVDSKGRIKSISSVDTNSLGLPNGTVTNVGLSGSSSITVSGSPINTSGIFEIDLSSTGVVPGTYTLSTFTVDQKGRILSASSGTSTDIGVTRVTLNGSNAITVTGSPITSQGTFSVDLSATGVAAGNYQMPLLQVDAQGRILSATNGQAVTTVSVNSNDLTLNGQNVTGAGTSLTATGGILITLTNTGITPGSYFSPNIVVDSKGRIRSIQNGGSGGTVTSVGVMVGPGLEVSGSPITAEGNISIALAQSGVVPGNYSKVLVDNLGRVLVGNAISESDIIGALGYLPAPIDSPEFVGYAKGTTAPQGDNTINFATTEFVQREIANAVVALTTLINNLVTLNNLTP